MQAHRVPDWDDHPREECGVVGLFDVADAARGTYLGLFALQHRGQESAGRALVTDGDIRVDKGMGLVSEVLSDAGPPGVTRAIGHVRYSTTGSSTVDNAQPLLMRSRFGPMALAHNGNLTNYGALRRSLEARGAIFQTSSDSEVLAHLVAHGVARRWLTALEGAAHQLLGGFAYVVLTPSALVGIRDPHGIRPLVLGHRGEGVVMASETAGLDAMGAEYDRDVDPGEMVVITEAGVESRRPWGPIPTDPTPCAFEMVYFSRPDSVAFGQSVHRTRRALGRQLWKEQPAAADVVVGVPDSSLPAAMGYAEAAGLPLDFGLVKNRYVGRTFIVPNQGGRTDSVAMKLSAVDDVVRGRRVALVDDSLVRGTTAARLVELLRRAGAREVHMRIASPPYTHPCHYGIDTSRSRELAAASLSRPELLERIGADSLGYLSESGLTAALPGRTDWCLACFGGGYPVPIEGDEEDQTDVGGVGPLARPVAAVPPGEGSRR
jgi:amidophosphoribosyltransferase